MEAGLFAPLPTALELVRALEVKVAALERRLASVDAKATSAWHYDGPWRADGVYSAGSVVLDHGCLWLSTNGAAAGHRPARRDASGWAAWRVIVRTCRCGQSCRRCGAPA